MTLAVHIHSSLHRASLAPEATHMMRDATCYICLLSEVHVQHDCVNEIVCGQ